MYSKILSLYFFCTLLYNFKQMVFNFQLNSMRNKQ